MNALDTNILLYVHDPRVVDKQARAAALVKEQTDAVLLWQVACEYPAASRKLAPLGYSLADAYQDIVDLRSVWYTALPSWGVVERARELLERYSLSYWDAMLAAACLEAGVKQLYTEDFGGCAELDGLRIVNPLQASSS
jgi:predicted nucleic acid-binding protein